MTTNNKPSVKFSFVLDKNASDEDRLAQLNAQLAFLKKEMEAQRHQKGDDSND